MRTAQCINRVLIFGLISVVILRLCSEDSEDRPQLYTCSGVKSSSTTDLQTVCPKVKRHSSLVTSLSSKAMRVKSRIAGSIFNKGKLRYM